MNTYYFGSLFLLLIRKTRCFLKNSYLDLIFDTVSYESKVNVIRIFQLLRYDYLYTKNRRNGALEPTGFNTAIV